MKTRNAKRYQSRIQAPLLALFICVFCLFGALGLAGCTPSTPPSNPADREDTGAMNTEVVSGTILEIMQKELLIEISESTAPGVAQGLVRCDISQIDSNIIKDLKVGDEVTFEFSGVTGMSEPPFVSATSLELSK